MALTATIKTPVASTFGGFTALPIMSARLSEISAIVLPDEAFNQYGVAVVPMPERCQSIELSFRNTSDETDGVVSFIAVSSEPASPELALGYATVAIPRVVPASGQVVEHRRAVEDDYLIIQRSHSDLLVTIHAHLDEVQA